MDFSDTPSMSTSPRSTASSPERQLSSVLFPEPLGPITPTISPRATTRSMSRSAFTCNLPVSYVFETARASTMGSLALMARVSARAGGGASWLPLLLGAGFHASRFGSGPDVAPREADDASPNRKRGGVMKTATDSGEAPARPLRSIRVGEVMHEGVLTCGRDESLAAVAQLMADHRVHSIVVTGEPSSSSLWGVVSDLDLVAAASVR